VGEGQGLCDASTKSIALNTVMMGGGGFWWRVKKCPKLRDTIYGRALNKASSQIAVEQLFKWNIPNHIALHSAFTWLSALTVYVLQIGCMFASVSIATT